MSRLRYESAQIRVLLLAILVLAGCQPRGSQHGPQQGPLVCETGVIDVGVVCKPRIEHEFFVTNVSNAPIRIARIQKSCSCLDPELSSSEIQPGDRRSVRLVANLPGKGRIPFEHYLSLEVDGAAPLPLVIRGIYQPVASLEHELIRAEILPGGGNVDVSAKVQFKRDDAARPDGQSDYHSHVDGLEWLRLTRTTGDQIDKHGVRYDVIRLTGTCPKDEELPCHGMLRLRWGDDDVSQSAYPIVVAPQFIDSVQQYPNRIALGVLKKNERRVFHASVRWQTAAGFRVESVVCGPRVGIDHQLDESNEESRMDITGSFTAPPQPGGVQETIAIKLENDLQQRTIEWPLSGWVEE